MTAGGDAERERQVRAAGWKIMEDRYTHTIHLRHAFSLSPLIGKIIHQSSIKAIKVSVEVQTEVGVAGKALSGQRVNLKDEGFLCALDFLLIPDFRYNNSKHVRAHTHPHTQMHRHLFEKQLGAKKRWQMKD